VKRIVNTLFEKAKANRPAVIFIGEVDSFLSSNNHNAALNTIEGLTEQMKSIEQDSKGLLILIGSNYPWKVHYKVLSLFNERIYIPLHDKETRISLFKRRLRNTLNLITEKEYEELGEMTKLFSGWDISMVIRSAKMTSVRKCQSARKFVVTDEGFYIATCPSDPNGIECTISTIPDSTKLKPPPICFDDLVNALSSATFVHFKITLGLNTERCDDWNTEFGLTN
jgi:vacuolar protein-sorting-associated protein 4